MRGGGTLLLGMDRGQKSYDDREGSPNILKARLEREGKYYAYT
jgi:hypothetical protein